MNPSEGDSNLQGVYTNNPQDALSQPEANVIAIQAVNVRFGGRVVHYAARTITIPIPSEPVWMYVTIPDPRQLGDPDALLGAVASTSDELCGQPGHTYMGALRATPEGNGIRRIVGGWPAASTSQVGI